MTWRHRLIVLPFYLLSLGLIGWVLIDWSRRELRPWLLWLAILVQYPGHALFWFWEWQERRKKRRAERGLCRQCGYDLRESPGRCPECGAAAAAAKDA
jgi:hypothetical protein